MKKEKTIREESKDWNRLRREQKASHHCLWRFDVAKFVNTAKVCTIYGGILQELFEFDGSMTGFHLTKKHIVAMCEAYSLTQVIVCNETIDDYYEDLVRLCMDEEYIVRI
jgi:transposase